MSCPSADRDIGLAAPRGAPGARLEGRDTSPHRGEKFQPGHLQHFCVANGNLYGTILFMPQAREYEDRDGQSPFASWFNALDATAAAKVRKAVAKLEAGLRPNVKSVGKGVHEAQIDFGVG